MNRALLMILLMTSINLFSHPGGTDSRGGHHDRKNGGYHFHHGKAAHQHPNGKCPYDNNGSSSILLIILGAGISSLLVYIIINEKISQKKERKQQRDKLAKTIEIAGECKIISKEINKILNDVNFKISNNLNSLPDNLEWTLAKCKFCKSYKSTESLMIKFKAQIHYHYVCYSCASKRTSLGRGQKVEKFNEALLYSESYNNSLEEINKVLNKADFNIKYYQIKPLFDVILNEYIRGRKSVKRKKIETIYLKDWNDEIYKLAVKQNIPVKVLEIIKLNVTQNHTWENIKNIQDSKFLSLNLYYWLLCTAYFSPNHSKKCVTNYNIYELKNTNYNININLFDEFSDHEQHILNNFDLELDKMLAHRYNKQVITI